MTFIEFQELVTSQVRRTITSFSVEGSGGLNLVQVAANMAKRAAQMERRFYHNEVTAYAELNENGVLYNSALLDSKGGTALPNVESVLHIYEYCEDGSLGNELTFVPVQKDRRWKDHLSGYVYLRAGRLYYRNVDENITTKEIYLDVNQHRPDYSADADTDFFLTNGAEWLLYKTMTFLQMRVKEDERLMITRSMLRDAWEAFVRWDTAVDFDQQDGIDLD